MSALTMSRKVIRFKNNLHEEFNKTLNNRVNDYFKSSKVGRYANAEIVFKTLFMFVLYLMPYCLLVFGKSQTTLLLTPKIQSRKEQSF